MSSKIPPICIYPTTVVLVDDNQRFLADISENLQQKGIKLITFDSCEKAFIYLESQPKPQSLLSKQNQDDDQTSSVSIDFNTVLNKRYDNERYNEVSVVVADYDMPDMKGNDFLCILSNRNAKKIMLTGYADHPTAINLLNHKIIDTFIEKKPSNAGDKLYEQIIALQQAYFAGLTQPITEHLLLEAPYLSHDTYQQLLQEVINAHDVIEHYLISNTGSRFMKTRHGKEIWLTLAGDDDIEGWLETAEYADAPKAIVDALKNRRQIPVFTSEAQMDASPQEWTSLMVNTKKAEMDGMKIYYALAR